MGIHPNTNILKFILYSISIFFFFHTMGMFTIELTRGKFVPSFSPDYHITFHFKFDLKIYEFVANHHGISILTRTIHETIDDSTRVAFKIHPQRTTKEVARLFAHDTSEAITSIIERLPIMVSNAERETLIDFAIKESRGALRNSMYDGYEAVDLYIHVRKEDRHVFDPYEYDEGSEYCCMVPAADTSVRLLLKECDGEKVGSDERCCICYEEFDSTDKRGCDVDLLKMPCEHIFHGECIKEWLRFSHCCPLCRYQMPTEAS